MTVLLDITFNLTTMTVKVNIMKVMIASYIFHIIMMLFLITVYVYITIDIDECLNTSLCSDYCFNTEGSYHCNCSAGYTLQPNQHDCEGWLHNTHHSMIIM